MSASAKAAVTDEEAESAAAGCADTADGATAFPGAAVAEEEVEAAGEGADNITPCQDDC